MDTDFTMYPVCPYCGDEEPGAWEIDFGPGLEGDTVMTCQSCERAYAVSRHVTVTYRTAALRGEGVET